MKTEELPDLLDDASNSSATIWFFGAYNNAQQQTHRYCMASTIARSQSRQILPVEPSKEIFYWNALRSWEVGSLIKMAATIRKVLGIFAMFQELFSSQSSIMS
jgi:hypothetical protein